MGILVSPTFNEAGSEDDKQLGENVVISARKQGLNLTVLESFGHDKSSKVMLKSKSGYTDNTNKQAQEVDGDVVINQGSNQEVSKDNLNKVTDKFEEEDNYDDDEFNKVDEQDDVEPQKLNIVEDDNDNQEPAYTEPDEEYNDDF